MNHHSFSVSDKPIAQDFLIILLKDSLFFGLVLTIIWQGVLLERGNNHTAPEGQGLCTHKKCFRYSPSISSMKPCI